MQFAQGSFLLLVPIQTEIQKRILGGTALVFLPLQSQEVRLFVILRNIDGAVMERTWSRTLVVLEQLADDLMDRPVEFLR
jgi:hypothetical protein